MQVISIGFLIMIILEIISIIWVTDWLGGIPTILLMIGSFLVGIMMLRHTGISGLLMASATIRDRSNVSMYQLLWPLRYTVAAILFLSPGFASLLIAILLLLPIKGKPLNSATFSSKNPFQHSSSQQGDIIEGEYTVNNPSDQPPQKKLLSDHKD